jgi:hypothetical protein
MSGIGRFLPVATTGLCSFLKFVTLMGNYFCSLRLVKCPPIQAQRECWG